MRATELDGKLEQWAAAGVLDSGTVARIREFEQQQSARRSTRWPVQVALWLGSIAMGAGVLLFVAAHWDELSPSARFSLVLLLVAVFHVAGALTASRSRMYATAMHALGTLALGAGVFLAGQIFNMQEHWPGGVMLWALGAVAGYVLLRDSAQAVLAALLVPAWLVGEWLVRTETTSDIERQQILGLGLMLIGIAYLGVYAVRRTPMWRALGAIGTLAALVAVMLIAESGTFWGSARMSWRLQTVGWALAILLPSGFATAVSRRLLAPTLLAALWGASAVMISRTTTSSTGWGHGPLHFLGYLWIIAGAAALTFWGKVFPEQEVVRVSNIFALVGFIGMLVWAQDRFWVFLLAALLSAAWATWGVAAAEIVNINGGIAFFALTVAWFYFSQLMDMIGRSAGLIGVGVLFLAGGWALERTRKQLIVRAKAS